MSILSSPALRRKMRQQRRVLSFFNKKQASIALAAQLMQLNVIRQAQHIACYLPNDGEISLIPFIEQCWRLGKICYLPYLQPHKPSLWFVPYFPDSAMKNNYFGIPEPQAVRQRKPVWALNCVLTPLVAFDAKGKRMGMGGGYYDRCFAYLQRQTHRQQPRLIGVAYDFQEVEALKTQPWDVPLQGVITESRQILTLE
jgi:5-formyltetrahydrofolate cyclo-ligase